jgi:hypothetical protein
MQTIRRDWLHKQIDAGKMEVKCNYHFTDDYAFDNANKGGATEWMPARIRRPTFSKYVTPGGWENDYCSNDDHIEGTMSFHLSDFTGKSGMAYWGDEAKTLIRFSIHSNASYTLRFKAPATVAAAPVKPRIRIMAVARQIA